MQSIPTSPRNAANAANPVTPQNANDVKRLSLVGVIFQGSQRIALISLDGGPPQSLAISSRVLGAQLLRIEHEYVVLEHDGAQVTVRMSGLPSPSAPVEVAVTAPLSPPLAQAAGGLAKEQTVGTGNAAFLDAVEKAGQRSK